MRAVDNGPLSVYAKVKKCPEILFVEKSETDGVRSDNSSGRKTARELRGVILQPLIL